jgi:hypothetical protein
VTLSPPGDGAYVPAGGEWCRARYPGPGPAVSPGSSTDVGGGAGGNGGPYPGLAAGFSSPPADGSTADGAGSAHWNMGPAGTAGGGGTADGGGNSAADDIACRAPGGAPWDRGTPGACVAPRAGSPFWAGSPP